MKENNKKETPSLSRQVEEQTGFILEHNVATILEANDWAVIHNRFYLDDVQAVQREIDILAYKVSEYDDVKIFTTLIISCKKSAYKDWIFLTRKSNGTKWNLDTSPFIYWSNSDIINFQLKDLKFNDLKYCDVDNLKYLINSFEYNRTVFAFREYDNKQVNNKLTNDTGIYDSIITLIKSQAFELESLPNRRKEKTYYYNINLLTVADVNKFIEIECDKENITEKEIDRINYVNRFLVSKKEHVSRITFVKYDKAKEAIEDFNLLHKTNCEIVENGLKNFYSTEILTNWRARKMIVDKHGALFLRQLKGSVINRIEISDDDFQNLYFNYIEDEILEIEFNASEKLISFLNNDEISVHTAREWLNEYFRYYGEFKFTINELPF